jgi:hypothetical protein
MATPPTIVNGTFAQAVKKTHADKAPSPQGEEGYLARDRKHMDGPPRIKVGTRRPGGKAPEREIRCMRRADGFVHDGRTSCEKALAYGQQYVPIPMGFGVGDVQFAGAPTQNSVEAPPAAGVHDALLGSAMHAATKPGLALHVRTACRSDSHCAGVKRTYCPLASQCTDVAPAMHAR